MLSFSLLILLAHFGIGKSQAPIPNRLVGWSYDPKGEGEVIKLSKVRKLILNFYFTADF